MDNQPETLVKANEQILKEEGKIDVQEVLEEKKECKRILISYQGEWYDVTDFSHPGEGAGIYLSDFNGLEVDEEVDNAHMTDEPQCMLAQAKKKNNFYGIKYVGKIQQTDEEEK